MFCKRNKLQSDWDKRSSNVEVMFSGVSVILLPAGLTMTCPSTYTAQENERHNLTCAIDSYFGHKVIWFKDEEEVNLPERLIRSDAGQYLIVASNHHTSVNRTVDIIVTCKSSIRPLTWVVGCAILYKCVDIFSYLIWIVFFRSAIIDSWAWRLWSLRGFRSAAQMLFHEQSTANILVGLLPHRQCEWVKRRWSDPSADPQCHWLQYRELHVPCLEWRWECLQNSQSHCHR